MIQALKNARQAGRGSEPEVTSLTLTDWASASNALQCEEGYMEDITDEELIIYWESDEDAFENLGFSYDPIALLVLWD